MASKKYTYCLTETAISDIDEVFEYITFELSNPDAAASFADSLEEKLEELCKDPKTGHLIENEYLKRDDVRRILVGNYIAYYIIDDEKKHIVVLRVVYGRREQDKVLKDL